MKIIYVAGPYRGKSEREVFHNIVRAREAALKLWDEGWAVICPHTNSMFMGSRLGGDEAFIEGDLEILRRCDIVYFLKGWQKSKGASLEWEEATKLKKEIYYQ